MRARDLLEADARWTQRLRLDGRTSLLRLPAAVLAHSGDSWFWLIGLGVVWLLGDATRKSWAFLLSLAILGLAAVVLGLKLSFRRRRPEGNWGSIYRKTDPHSFPSGHAARAAMLAALVSGWGPAWLAPVLIAWAPLVMLARVTLGLHYLSDVAAGLVIGLAAGLILLALVTV